jgi:glycerol kinase
VETTALGAAYLAGIATGFWRDEAEVASLRAEQRRFTPKDGSGASEAYGRWRAAVQGLLGTKLAPLGDT